MTIAIDQVGRLVLPKPIRKQLCLIPGSLLNVAIEDDGIKLTIPAMRSTFVRKQGVMVHQDSSPTQIDISDFISGLRSERGARILEDAK